MDATDSPISADLAIVARFGQAVVETSPHAADAAGRLLNEIKGEPSAGSWDEKVANVRLGAALSTVGNITDVLRVVDDIARGRSHHSLRTSKTYVAIRTVDARVSAGGKREVLVRWANYDGPDTWEPADDFEYLELSDSGSGRAGSNSPEF